MQGLIFPMKLGHPKIMTIHSTQPLLEKMDFEMINNQASQKQLQQEFKTDDLPSMESAQTDEVEAMRRKMACMVHEINNPLTAVKNMFMLFKSTVDKEFPYYEFFDMVDNELCRISSIIDKTVTDVKIRSGEPMIGEGERKRPLDKIIKETCNLLDKKCKKHDVKLAVSYSNRSQNRVYPENPLRQIINNIIHNAIDASSKGDEIKIHSTIAKNKELSIRINDQGCGIPKQIQGRIFDDYFSTKKSAKSQNMGMGLPISRELIQNLNGRIDFVSKEGEGTSFKIKIPFHK